MPFTFAHPAIVLPLARLSKRYVSLTGLIAGSLAPDFEYFVRMIPHSEYSHTLQGIFFFNLPVAILISFLFHFLVRNEIIDHLPKSLYYRFYSFKSFNWLSHVKQHSFPFIASIIIGAFSHILWDSFTHEGGFFVQLLPVLKTKISHFPVYRLFQHGSTVAGFTVIGWVILKLDKTFSKPPVHSIIEYWIVVALITVLYVAGLIGLFFTLRKYYPYHGVFVVAAINGFMLGVVLSSLLSKYSLFRGTREKQYS